MNEYRWEKLDADMRSDMAEEYIQERCPHEDVYINEITVKIQSKPVDGWDLDSWKIYLQKVGTEMFELYAEVVCEKCGASQEQHIDLDAVLETGTWEWEE